MNLQDYIKVNAEGHVRRHESSVIEYKANFSMGSLAKYARTMVAFANNRGGVIVFGVTNSPRQPKGMTNQNWSTLDPEKLTGELNRLFSPELQYNLDELALDDGRRFGYIIVHESGAKPIVAVSNKGDDVKDGEIYYRYSGRSTVIRSAELQAIIAEIKAHEQQQWMAHIGRIARIGVDKAAVFDPVDGSVRGSRGSFIIHKELLPKLKFIREGHFVETDGIPAVTIIGSAKIVSGEAGEGFVGITERAISENDIFLNFLNEVNTPSPLEYLKACVAASSKFMPIYYYINKAGFTLTQYEIFVSSCHGYPRFKYRIKEDPKVLPLKWHDTGSQAFKEKLAIKKELESGLLRVTGNAHRLRRIFEVVRTVEDHRSALACLSEAYKLPLRDLGVIPEFRKAACYVDFRKWQSTEEA